MITFDPLNKRIILDAPDITATELYSRSVDWLAISDNIKYGAIFRQVGGDDLGGGISIPPYYFLQNTWRIRPMEQDHTLTLSGNLFTENGDDPVVKTIGNYNVLVKSVVPVQAQGISISGSGTTGPTASAIASAVWQDAMAVLVTQQAILARKMQTNKAVISDNGGLVTIYDDDQVTVLCQFNISQDKNTRTPI